MSESSQNLTRLIHRELEPMRFQRRGRSWTRRLDDVVQIVELQGSEWGPTTYLNLGLWITAIAAPTPILRERDAHIRVRVTEVLSAPQAASLTRALDPEDAQSEEDRSGVLSSVLKDGLLPVLEQWSSLTALRQAMLRGAFEGALVVRVAREALTAMP